MGLPDAIVIASLIWGLAACYVVSVMAERKVVKSLPAMQTALDELRTECQTCRLDIDNLRRRLERIEAPAPRKSVF